MFSVMRAQVKHRDRAAMRRNAGTGNVFSARAFCYSTGVPALRWWPCMTGVGQDKPVVGGGTGHLAPPSQIGGAAGCDMVCRTGRLHG